MSLARRLRIPALLCPVAVLLCELVAHPVTTMGVCDDGPYILMAKTFADTGHIVFNGWAAAMLLAQLYLGAAFVKLFGYSYTTVRMSTLLVAAVTAFLLQRTLVRAGISERNATLGTLALVCSPLYLVLSVTYMSDIFGLFAIVLCIYGCLGALKASTDRRALTWLAFAISTNVLCGTSRQIAWLSTLVMVPCAIWLLRTRRRLLIAGAALNFAGILVIFACLHWLKHQRYVIPVPLLVSNFPLKRAFSQLGLLLLGAPFFLLPIVAVFFPELWKKLSYIAAILIALLVGFLFLATYPSHLRGFFVPLLDPTGAIGSWVTAQGMYLSTPMQVVLTIASTGGFFGVILSILRARRAPSLPAPSPSMSWRQLAMLFVPFSGAYLLLLLSAAGTTYTLFDRYALGLLAAALLCLVRLYQERIHAQLPLVSMLLIAFMAAYGVALTHNTFALDRARVALADELHASGLPDTSLDGGWEANFDVELRHADHINNPLLVTAANGYTQVSLPPSGDCKMLWSDRTPHVRPLYSISFDPNACYGPAPFAPAQYSRWPYSTPGTLYVVRYTPPHP